MRFANRIEAGRQLAHLLDQVAGADLVVLGLPRGGVPVAAEVARALGAALDVIVVRKLGVPFQPELAMGAVGEDGVAVLNHGVVRAAGIDSDELAAVEQAARDEVDSRVRRLRPGRPAVPLTGRTVVIVDDGIATGATMRAACRVARARGAAQVLVAVPVAAAESVAALRDVADEVVCAQTPASFSSVGQWYDDFTPTADEEVAELVAGLAEVPPAPPAEPAGSAGREVAGRPAGPVVIGAATDPVQVTVGAGPLRLSGLLTVPPGAAGVVVFVHGSGSSRHSPRNRYVADRLNRAGLGTLLFDLLSHDEESDWRNVFNIEMLAGRLVTVVGWLRGQPVLGELPVGLFGASTGAAAALWAATEPDAGPIAAVVSRGGRPDLAGQRLPLVTAPTLLLVGSHDDLVLDLNRAAQNRLTCLNRLDVVPGATHLFEEPGALQAVAELAAGWFAAHLAVAGRPVATAG